MAVIYPTLMALDFLNVQDELEKIDEYASGYQFDIMDNHFVPNLTYGPDFVNAVCAITHKKIWLHLMVDDPQSLLDRFFIPPGSIVTFHVESKANIIQTIEHIKTKKWLPGIAVNPKTLLEVVYPLLPLVHQIMVMAVEPGFARQDFLPETYVKIEHLGKFRQSAGLPFRIGVDGGIKASNIAQVVAAGVDDIAVASAIFMSKDPLVALQELTSIVVQSKK